MALIVASVPELTMRRLFDGRVDPAHEFGRSDSTTVGRRSSYPVRPLPEGFYDAGMGVADDHRSPGADVVDVFVAVDIGDGTALARAMNGGGQPMRL